MAPGETTPWRRKGWAKRKKSTAASAVLKPPKEDGGDFPFAIFLSWSLPYLPVFVRLVGLIVKR